MMGNKPAHPSGPGTVVGANVKIIGTLSDANDVTIHGQVEGEVVSSQQISITETAYIKGPVSGDVVSIAGKVRGSITATGKLEIMPTGKVFGSITSKDLSIKSGAVFVGKCTMPDQEKEAEEEPIEPAEKEKAPEEPENKPAYEVE